MPAIDEVEESRPRRKSSASNALARGFGLLGDEWSLLLLRLLLQGTTRYSQFKTALPISDAVLTSRLDLLVRESVVRKSAYQRRPIRSEYLLTDRGRATWPVLASMGAWERTWVSSHDYLTPPMRHNSCGSDFSPVLVCASCEAATGPRDLDATWGPTGGWRKSVPETTTRRRSGTWGATADRYFYPDTMTVFGNRWSAVVVASAFFGTHRFTDFQSVLGIPRSLLAERLSALCAHGIFEQVQTSARPDWAEYRLSDKGLAFFPVIGTAIGWAERWLGSKSGPAMNLIHLPCESTFHGVLACDHCGGVLSGSDVAIGRDG